MDDILLLADLVLHQKEELRSSLPYQMNLIEAIGADENANSRIVAKLLEQHDQRGHYAILEQFLTFAFGHFPFSVEKPAISTEFSVNRGKRIDIFVYEQDKYAIIFENKIMEAGPQQNQLANYIDGVRALGFDDESIYVVYLPATNDTVPDDVSWRNRNGISYEQAFRSRFRNVSFRDCLLPWLKDTVAPSLLDEQLTHVVAQYVNYLEGLFRLRPNDHYIDMSITKTISERLSLTDNDADTLTKVMAAVCSIEALRRDIVKIGRKAGQNILQGWLSRLRQDFPEVKFYDRSSIASYASIGLNVDYGAYSPAFAVTIQFDYNHSVIYYGVTTVNKKMPFDEAKELLQPIMEQCDHFRYNPHLGWMAQNAMASDGYDKFVELLRTILSALANNSNTTQI